MNDETELWSLLDELIDEGLLEVFVDLRDGKPTYKVTKKGHQFLVLEFKNGR